MAERSPAIEIQDEGLLVILEPEQIRSAEELGGKTAVVTIADGQVKEYVIHHSEVHHGVVGVFFKDMKRGEIGRGALIRWK